MRVVTRIKNKHFLKPLVRAHEKPSESAFSMTPAVERNFQVIQEQAPQYWPPLPVLMLSDSKVLIMSDRRSSLALHNAKIPQPEKK